ncbi:nitroreductase/quinone reductase family protein [Microbacterium sp. 1P10UB]|uniref:nitroreductase/quinone reductase family protein n=1 Tax=unclassified Microbacterium TaxID=2609290 RepID=UPI0039A0D17C
MSAWDDKIIEEFRSNGGEVGRFGRSLVLMHHRGARSGTERVTPVMAIPDDGDGWLVAASKAGAPENPAWFHNLVAHPDIDLETPDGTVAVHADVLTGDERDRGWARFTDASEGFREYEKRTSRTIPVVRFSRR